MPLRFLSRKCTEHLRRFEMHLMSSLHYASSDIRALTYYNDRRNQHVDNLRAPRNNFNEKIVGDWAPGTQKTRQLPTSFSRFPRLLARKRLALELVHCQLSSQAPATEVLESTISTIADIKEKLRFALTGDYVAFIQVCPHITHSVSARCLSEPPGNRDALIEVQEDIRFGGEMCGTPI